MYKLYFLFSLLLLSGVTVHAQTNTFYYSIPGGPAEVLDLKDNRVLFWRDSAYHIHQLFTGNTIDIPLHRAPAFAERQNRSGWLTGNGAFITTIGNVAGMVALYEWRRDTLFEIEKQATSVEVGGDHVLWTSWGYFYRKMQDEEIVRISTNPGAFAMSPQGWYLYSIDDTLYRYKDGVTAPFATGEDSAERFLYVETDQQQVLYMMEKAHQAPTLYLYNGVSTDTVAILRGVHQQLFPKRQYHLHNGYVAFVSVDRQGIWPFSVAETNIYVRDVTGERTLAFKQIGARNVGYVYPEIRSINDAGGLLVRQDDYMWQNGLHYTALDSASKFIVPFIWNSYVPGTTYKNGYWYVFYRDSINRLFSPAFLPPVVSLSANINVVNNNTDTIIITAQGNGPGLYTFARDAGFANILKAESTDTVLKLHPSSFAKGNNDVYVRMKVGDSTATDKIRIVKTILHGIPGKNLIIVYPNPFTSQFTVEGLLAAHQYKLTLHALNGTVLYTTLASYLHKIPVVPDVTLRKGIYFLEVFDLTVQKVAGGTILIKL